MTKRYEAMRFLVCYTLLAGIGGVFIFVFGLYEELGLFNRIDFNHQQSMFFRLKAVLFFLFVFFTVAEIFFIIPVLCLAISILVIKIKKSIFSSLLVGAIGGGGITLWSRYVLTNFNLNDMIVFCVGFLILSLGTYLLNPFLPHD